MAIYIAKGTETFIYFFGLSFYLSLSTTSLKVWRLCEGRDHVSSHASKMKQENGPQRLGFQAAVD